MRVRHAATSGSQVTGVRSGSALLTPRALGVPLPVLHPALSVSGSEVRGGGVGDELDAEWPRGCGLMDLRPEGISDRAMGVSIGGRTGGGIS